MEGFMEQVTHCRNCGKVMKNDRIDNYRMKVICSCGFSDYRPIKAKLNAINPFHHKADFTPWIESEKNKIHLTIQKATRASKEIMALDQISTLIYEDASLPDMLQEIVKKAALHVRVNVCSIYLLNNDELVLAATHGFDTSFIGRIRMKVGEGITGNAAKNKKAISLSHASHDPRYKYFPELKEERYNTMLSIPIMDKSKLYGVINYNSTSMKSFHNDNLNFISIINNLILTAIKLREGINPAGGPVNQVKNLKTGNKTG
jgi:putative methionine-R-sulfoxide reductase with GAF domain